MRKHYYGFIKNGKTIHTMAVPDMTEKEYELFSSTLKNNKEYLKYRKRADDVFVYSERDDEYIISRYNELMRQRIDENCDWVGASDCEKENMMGFLNHLSIDEIAEKRGIKSTGIHTENGRLKDKMHLKKQKANSYQSMLRVLMRNKLGI